MYCTVYGTSFFYKDDPECTNVTKILPSEAVQSLNTILQWAEDHTMHSIEIMLFRRLRDRAFEMQMSTTVQKKITDFLLTE
jgi:hypothetical protein